MDFKVNARPDEPPEDQPGIPAQRPSKKPRPSCTSLAIGLRTHVIPRSARVGARLRLHPRIPLPFVQGAIHAKALSTSFTIRT